MRPVENVVVAELNLLKSLAARQPAVVEFAVRQLRVPDVLVKPEPVRLLNDEPLMTRFVVDAVANDE